MHRLVAILVVASAMLCAQTNRGSIAGTVTDATGGAVTGAKVTVTNIGTNEIRKATSAANGAFDVADLEPALYNIQVEAAGFKKSVVENVKVDTGLTAGIAIKLETGSVETKITVEAESVMVDTESGTSANTINERQIDDVPLLNRSVMDLALTLPNVAGDAGSEEPVLTTVTPCPGCNLTIAGGRPMSNMLLADGTNNTGVSVGRTIVSFTPETVQEFTVTTSVPSAEYGFSGGGVINATTKSGTNELHGTLLWYNRNTAVEAAPFTLATVNRSPPTLKDNQFSLAVGGPVWIPKIYNGKNKTFWFAAIEPQYRRDHLDQYGTMPTPGMRNGDFSGVENTASGWIPTSVVSQYAASAPTAVALTGDNNIYDTYNVVNGNQFQPATIPTGQTTYTPFPGNIIPQSMLDSTAIKALPYIAQAGPYFLNSNGLISNIYDPRLLKTDTKRYLVRIDETISNKNRLTARWTSTPIVKIAATAVSPTNDGYLYSWGQQAMIADTHTFSPTLFNDIRLNFTHGRFSNTVGSEWDPISGANLNTAFGLPNITQGGLPTFNSLFPGSSLGGGSSNATGFGGAGSTNQDDKEYRYGITDIVYKNVGAMSFKFGFDGSHALQNIIPLYGAFGGIYTFSNYPTDSNGASSGTGGSPWASFMLGTVQSGDVTMRNVVVPYYYRWNTGAGFVQDDWKVKSNLTINFGVRWTLQMPRTEKFNHQGVFRPDLAQSVTLPTPLTLQDGEVLTSTLEVPFAFSGLGGNSRSMTKPQYDDFEPRFGFAWQPDVLRSHHVVVRGGWGMTHAPISGFTTLPQPDFGATSTFATVPTSATANPTMVMRLGENPPVLTPATPTTQIYGTAGPPSSGLTYPGGLYYQSSVAAYAVSTNYHTPYANNWNLTLSWQANRSTTMEVAYQGSQGIHLFMPEEDINPKDSNLISAQLAQNVSTTATINDPLGRINPLTGKVLTVQEGSLGSPYLGMSSLYRWYDSSGNSVRHAGYFNVVHRAARGLTYIANYTYSKSMDVASSACGDKNILTPVNGQTCGQVSFGGTRANDRSVSTFDQRHVVHGSVIYDLPLGRGRQFLGNMPKFLDYVVGGWTLSGLVRLNSGFPYEIYLSDTNQLGDLTHAARPDVAYGVPILNPLYTKSCPIGTGCQPYLNPSAFQRPALGSLGTAPRTEDGARGPWAHYTDANIQKNFRLGESGRRVLQIRMDALNVFNHPVFEVYPNNAGGADFMGAPSTSTLTTASYNTWAAANNQPSYSTAAGVALYNSIVAMVNGQRIGSTSGALPANFFATRLPSNFFGVAANAYDITTLQGYKNYQLRTAYNTGFGDLYQAGSPRYIQFGLKLYF
jgi:hypothetical protein